MQRLDFKEALSLYKNADLFELGKLAHSFKERLHGKNYYYTINRHINYTNVCIMHCKFCAYHCSKDDERAYVLEIDEVLRKISESPNLREVHIVGGLNPDLPYDYYVELISAIRKNFPTLRIRGFTCVEVDFLSKISGKDVAEVLTDLKRAGLNALPGGGAEIFSDRLREELYPAKIDHRRWLEIAKTAHKLGLKSNATLLFGHLETEEEIIEHLIMLRAAQDETGGFECFVPLPFLPENTKLSHLPPVSAQKILRTFAISRLVLDNFPHIKSYWVFLGVGLAQVALLFGADHFHGTVIEEKISESHKSEVITNLPQDEIEKLIKEIGGNPVLI